MLVISLVISSPGDLAIVIVLLLLDLGMFMLEQRCKEMRQSETKDKTRFGSQTEKTVTQIDTKQKSQKLKEEITSL